MSTLVIEWAPFTLAAGATESELLAASETLQADFLSRQDGFVKRELLRETERQWCDLVYWESEAAARRAVENAAASPVCHRYFQLMEAASAADPGAGVRHLSVRRTYGTQAGVVAARRLTVR